MTDCEHAHLVSESIYRCKDCGVRGPIARGRFQPFELQDTLTPKSPEPSRAAVAEVRRDMQELLKAHEFWAHQSPEATATEIRNSAHIASQLRLWLNKLPTR